MFLIYKIVFFFVYIVTKQNQIKIFLTLLILKWLLLQYWNHNACVNDNYNSFKERKGHISYRMSLYLLFIRISIITGSLICSSNNKTGRVKFFCWLFYFLWRSLSLVLRTVSMSLVGLLTKDTTWFVSKGLTGVGLLTFNSFTFFSCVLGEVRS